MSTKQIMFVSFVFFIGTICCLIGDGIFLGQDQLDIANALTGYNITQVQTAGLWSIPKLGWGFVTHGLPKMLMWDYSFLNNGGYFIIRMLLIFTLSVGVIWGVTTTFIGAAQGLLSKFL